MAECEKVNIPKTDNSEIECEEYFKGECIYMTNLTQDIIDYYEFEDPTKMEDIVVTILESIKDIRTRIVTLENI